MRPLITVYFLLLTALACFGQTPVISEPPQNAASYAPAGLANGSLAQGTMFVVKGNGFGPCNTNNTVIASTFPLQNTMRSVQIRVTVGGQTYNGKMIYVVVCRGNGPDQLAAILPSNVPVGSGTMQVVLNGTLVSAPVPVKVVARSFGIFTWNQAGSGPMIVQNFISSTNTPTNGLLEAANPGQTEILWGVGLGAVDSAAEIAGPVPGDMPITVDVYVGGKKANVIYRGRSGCCAGIDQIVFTVPAGVEGCYVSVGVVVNGVLSNVGTMSIASSGKVCAENSRLSSADISKVQKAGPLNIGDIQVVRFNLTAGSIQGSVDSGDGSFRRYASTAELMSAAPHSIAGLRGTASPGSCVTTTFDFGNGKGALDAAIPDFQDPAGSQLDAGANLTLSNSKGTKQLPRQLFNGFVDGYYLPDGTFLGGGVPAAGILLTPNFLDPGAITLTGSGGPGVGAFSANLTIPSTFATWSNQASINGVSRTQDLTINWSGGGSNELVAVFLASADSAIGSGAGVACVERASVGTMTIPAFLMSNMPASGTADGLRVGWITFGTTLAQPTRFNATGLDLGYFNWLTAQIKNVPFQ